MDRQTAIKLLEELANEETAFAEDLTKEGKEKCDRFIKAINAGIKALEQNKPLQNRCFALTRGEICKHCFLAYCERRTAEFEPPEEG